MPKQSASEPCPYKSLPDYAFWRRSVSNTEPGLLDPIVSTKFRISEADKIATAGSCFAQHIARFLSQSGYNYFVSEPGHEILTEETKKTYNYGTFSARFGNLYTTRQLLQLFQRAYGEFTPAEDMWEEGGRYVDPFRPFIQPRGFATEQEYRLDREEHFAAIRRMVETLDVFVFTLGLTEGWQSKEDGAVFAISPGCGAGNHDSSIHEFINFNVQEVTDDLRSAIEFIRARNPAARVLLTVSPVPLIATYEPQHVLVSTTYSKSVLRVAAETLKNEMSGVDYFPSYEIITGNFSHGVYYEDDLREIREQGVRHAMTCFFRHYLGIEIAVPDDAPAEKSPEKLAARTDTVNRRLAKVVCDEEQLESYISSD
jgi:hypothetical protein